MDFTPKRYWGGDDSKPKHCLTLEALHELALQRSKERAAAAVTRRKKKRLSNGRAHACSEEEDSVDKAGLPSSKRLKRSARREVEDLVGVPARKKALQRAGETVRGSPCTPSNGVVLDDEVFGGREMEEVEREEEEEEKGGEEEMSDVEERLSEAETGGSERNTSPSSDTPTLDQKTAESAEDEATPTLQPLGRDRGGTLAGRKIVHRKLPDWIQNFHTVENDIQKHSQSVEKFSLHKVMVENLRRCGVERFFPVQAHVVPFLLSTLRGPLLTSPGGSAPCDVCVCAPTGCGKTLCYVIPIVSALMKRVVQQVRAIVVVPSQELAVQVHHVFEQLARSTVLTVGVVCGCVSMESEQAMLRERGAHPPSSNVDVLVATPGRLVQHLDSDSFPSLGFVRFLVIDEADKLLDYHFSRWIPKLLSAISRDKATPKGRGLTTPSSLATTLESLSLHPERFQLLRNGGSEKTMDKVTPPLTTPHPPRLAFLAHQTSPLQKLLFSATMTQSPEHFALLRLRRPKLFSIADPLQLRGSGGAGALSEELTFGLPEQLAERRVRCDLKDKPLALVHLVKGCGLEADMRRVLCFTNSKDSTHRLFLLLKALGHFPVEEISSSVSRGRRQEILANFTSNSSNSSSNSDNSGGGEATRVLVCSDQMARGMDVRGVTCVVNYEPPRQFRIYLHRAGRTARAGQRGVVYTLLAQDEVHAFNVMMRQVGRRGRGKGRGLWEEEDLTIGSNDLQDYIPSYQDALQHLRHRLSSAASSAS